MAFFEVHCTSAWNRRDIYVLVEADTEEQAKGIAMDWWSLHVALDATVEMVVKDTDDSCFYRIN